MGEVSDCGQNQQWLDRRSRWHRSEAERQAEIPQLRTWSPWRETRSCILRLLPEPDVEQDVPLDERRTKIAHRILHALAGQVIRKGTRLCRVSRRCRVGRIGVEGEADLDIAGRDTIASETRIGGE